MDTRNPQTWPFNEVEKFHFYAETLFGTTRYLIRISVGTTSKSSLDHQLESHSITNKTQGKGMVMYHQTIELKELFDKIHYSK